jgi:hypothetical protein
LLGSRRGVGTEQRDGACLSQVDPTPGDAKAQPADTRSGSAGQQRLQTARVTVCRNAQNGGIDAAPCIRRDQFADLPAFGVGKGHAVACPQRDQQGTGTGHLVAFAAGMPGQRRGRYDPAGPGRTGDHAGIAVQHLALPLPLVSSAEKMFNGKNNDAPGPRQVP